MFWSIVSKLKRSPKKIIREVLFKKLLSFIVKSENIYKECFSLKCAQDCTAQVIDHFELKMNVMFWSIVSKLKRSPKKIIGEALLKKLLSIIVKSENIYKECFSFKCAQDVSAVTCK